MSGWTPLVSRIGVTTAGADTLLVAPISPRSKASVLRITFVGTVAATLTVTGLGTGAAAGINSGVAIPANTVWTGEGLSVREEMVLDFLVDLAGTYTLLVEEKDA